MSIDQVFEYGPALLGTLAGVITAEALRDRIALVTASVVTTVIFSALLIFVLEEGFRAGVERLFRTKWFKRLLF